MYFKINDKLAIGAERYETRYSWGHKAHLYRVRTPEYSDELIEKVKVTYYNRTWERYEFESAIKQVVGKALKKHSITQEESDTCYDYIQNYQEKPNFMLQMTANIAQLGSLLCTTQKDTNDWKARMLKAGLGEALDMPADWSQLSEDEKQSRLDKAIQVLA